MLKNVHELKNLDQSETALKCSIQKLVVIDQIILNNPKNLLNFDNSIKFDTFPSRSADMIKTNQEILSQRLSLKKSTDKNKKLSLPFWAFNLFFSTRGFTYLFLDS